MPTTDGTPATATHAETDDTLVRQLRDDMWSHRIYRQACSKMTALVLGILALTTAICGLTAFEFYYRLRDYATKTAVATIEQQITAQVNEQVDQMLKAAKPDLERRLSMATEGLIARTSKDAEAKIAGASLDATNAIAKASKDAEAEVAKAKSALNEHIAELEVASQLADAAAQRARDLSVAGQQPEPSPLPAATACNPNALSPDQIQLVGIRQRVTATGKNSDGGRPIYANSFTVETKPLLSTADSIALERCILDAVDRVVYRLNERWFSPSSAVRVDQRDHFRFGADVWGPTPIEATIYFKGGQAPLTSKGSFAAQATPDRFLTPNA